MHFPPLAALSLLFALAACVPARELDQDLAITALVQQGIQQGSEGFSHAALTELLRPSVRGDGRVDYSALRSSRAKLDDYLGDLAAVDLRRLSRDHLLALLINAYNASTLQLIVANLPLESIKDLDAPWTTPRCRLGGMTWTLDQIEHNLLRPAELFHEPRIHMAIHCASLGCPPLSREAYEGATIEAQLDAAARRCLTDPRYLRREGEVLYATQILNWFASDFTEKYGSLAAFLKPYAAPPVRELLEARGDKALSYVTYDWALNDVDG